MPFTDRSINLSVFGKMLETFSDLDEGLSHPIVRETERPKIGLHFGLVEVKSNDDGKVNSI